MIFNEIKSDRKKTDSGEVRTYTNLIRSFTLEKRQFGYLLMIYNIRGGKVRFLNPSIADADGFFCEGKSWRSAEKIAFAAVEKYDRKREKNHMKELLSFLCGNEPKQP